MHSLHENRIRIGYRELLLFLLLGAMMALPAFGASNKIHTVGLGQVKKVPGLPSLVMNSEATDEEKITLRVRPLIVDGKLKEWTTGEAHDVTDRSFAVRRAVRINDTLPSESAPRWIWERGPWLLVDRVSGHTSMLRLPDFDPAVSDVVWFRDYAAYCGVAASSKQGHLLAVVAQLGAHRALVQKPLGNWDADDHATPVCRPSEWQRQPLRVSFHPSGRDPASFDLIGLSAVLVDEPDSSDD